jgi:hypothetical protein
MRIAPVTLATLALGAICGIIPNFVPVVFVPAAALAIDVAANSLVGVILRSCEGLPAIGATA